MKMICEDCDLDRFIEAIEDLPYHELLVSTLKEGYAADDLLVQRRREAATDEEMERVAGYNRALRSFIFLLQTGSRPDLASDEDREAYNRFRRVAAKLVERGELLPAILDYFDG
ncbi:hypothetical protein [Candidatus Methanocrinis natronophilus]|uniref:Uncharacterized protein n=1 Tax=Candidatus Methanocrinis natronophilus TaxID=3033396 RepID=A0ABT5XAD1_9EURY|nr:hypothetical protein [Candidatus Methanocrinis natronophilus]MDF0591652.1 hypothetical protein [Candidatus Methanocrinis natronophilus]